MFKKRKHTLDTFYDASLEEQNRQDKRSKQVNIFDSMPWEKKSVAVSNCLGECTGKKCTGILHIRKGMGVKRFIRCDNAECGKTYPLPERKHGTLARIGICTKCKSPMLMINKTLFEFCANPHCLN